MTKMIPKTITDKMEEQAVELLDEEKEKYEQGKFHIVELTRNPGYDTFHGRATENWTDYF